MNKQSETKKLEAEKAELLLAKSKLDTQLSTMSRSEYWMASARTIKTGWTTAQAERFKEVNRKLNELAELAAAE